ncbi:MAG: type II secretion system protein [Patescibacteria group bacterium]
MKYQRSFTLLETIVAIYVLLAGIVGSMNLAQQNIGAITLFRHQLIAANLAQEGAELVRSKRDSNYIRCYRDPACYDTANAPPDNPNREFMKGITGTGGCDSPFDCYVTDPRGDASGSLTFTQCPLGVCPYLQLDSAGFYQYSSGPDTIFKRHIKVIERATLRDPVYNLYNLHDWEVVSRVEWREKLVDKSVEVKDILTPNGAL